MRIANLFPKINTIKRNVDKFNFENKERLKNKANNHFHK